MSTEYKDPKDLRSIPIERLKFEGSKLAHQFREWNDFFNIESAIRVYNKKEGLPAYEMFSEVDKWAIFSNRYLLMDREHLSDYKLFNKDEVLKMVENAYNQGFQDGMYSKEEGLKQHEASEEYMSKMHTI